MVEVWFCFFSFTAGTKPGPHDITLYADACWGGNAYKVMSQGPGFAAGVSEKKAESYYFGVLKTRYQLPTNMLWHKW